MKYFQNYELCILCIEKAKMLGYHGNHMSVCLFFSQNKLVVLLALCSCICQSLHRLNIPTTLNNY